MKEEELTLYVELAMKNLFFMKTQRENVVWEVQRLMKSKTLEEVKKELKTPH